MAEQRMKVRDKKVQKMTKDGLVEENLTDKSSVRVSNRASDVQMGGRLYLVYPQLKESVTQYIASQIQIRQSLTAEFTEPIRRLVTAGSENGACCDFYSCLRLIITTEGGTV